MTERHLPSNIPLIRPSCGISNEPWPLPDTRLQVRLWSTSSAGPVEQLRARTNGNRAGDQQAQMPTSHHGRRGLEAFHAVTPSMGIIE
ncbi:hypothetical protein, partial [Streptomyces sp. NBC_00250]|uniref:hypothetical protein n=1 Tax=Streptomyces sp. NBC_00250 TaxID=2903641 RepID=UPI002E2939E9